MFLEVYAKCHTSAGVIASSGISLFPIVTGKKSYSMCPFHISSGKHVREMYTLLHVCIKAWVCMGIPILLFLLQIIDCGYSLEPHWRGGFNVYPQSMFRAKL